MVKKLLKENFDRNVGSGTVMVDFYADWCAPCKKQAHVLENLVQKLDSKAKIYKVNIDESRDLASQYNVTSIPTILLFKDGKVVNSMVGYKTEAVLLGAIERA